MRTHGRPSLENLVEEGEIALETLHPGGLEITAELAGLCHIGRGSKVLDVASGTGESACYLAETFGCLVVGVDLSDHMVKKAEEKARRKKLALSFTKGDAHHLPFDTGTFDAVISECTVCLLDKERAISEMVRVAGPAGYVGIHDVCWKEDTPESLKKRLEAIEGERPETLDGWKDLFEKASLTGVLTVDKADLVRGWTNDIKRRIGLPGQARIFLAVLKRWGISGLRAVWESDRIFRNEHTGYGIIVGRKPTEEQVSGRTNVS
jgi:SAM-dependent methyltransferase